MCECNVNNRTIFCDDCLEVLRGINSECIDLIYLDPPFNKNKKFTAPIGSHAEGASFSDIFREEDVKDEWLKTIEEDKPEIFQYLNGIKGIGNRYNFAYLAYLAIRLIECHRVLKQSGSIYLHCDPTMSHYLKATMDCIFGEEHFRNEIVWCYPPGGKAPKYALHRKHDLLLFYAKSPISTFHEQFKEFTEYQRSKFTKRDSEGRAFKEYRGKTRTYLDELKGSSIPSWWTDIPSLGQTISKEKLGYPTQKPLALLERIIRMSSNEQDTVLDPFCGCATTCVAAERLGRQWIGIDISIKAYELVEQRLVKEVADPEDVLKYKNVIHLRTDPPQRTDLGEDYREHKHVYVISHPNFPNEFKVGVAKNWQSRLNSYQTSDPNRQYQLEFELLTPWFREIEVYVHHKFDNKHEWVAGDLQQIIDVIKRFQPPLHKSIE